MEKLISKKEAEEIVRRSTKNCKHIINFGITAINGEFSGFLGEYYELKIEFCDVCFDFG